MLHNITVESNPLTQFDSPLDACIHWLWSTWACSTSQRGVDSSLFNYAVLQESIEEKIEDRMTVKFGFHNVVSFRVDWRQQTTAVSISCSKYKIGSGGSVPPKKSEQQQLILNICNMPVHHIYPRSLLNRLISFIMLLKTSISSTPTAVHTSLSN